MCSSAVLLLQKKGIGQIFCYRLASLGGFCATCATTCPCPPGCSCTGAAFGTTTAGGSCFCADGSFVAYDNNFNLFDYNTYDYNDDNENNNFDNFGVSLLCSLQYPFIRKGD